MDECDPMERFGSSGARGPVETVITPEAMVSIAQAAVVAWDADRVAIGRDVRVTGESLTAAAAAGATSAGADVDTLGVLPTPAVQAYADRHGLHAMVITASHNPPPDNGIKLIAPDGGELSIPGYEAVETRLNREGTGPTDWDDFGVVNRVDGEADRYVDEVLANLDVQRIADAELRVVIDAGTGAGGYTTPTLCRQLGCDVVTLNAQPDGHFPARPSEPVPEALGDLVSVVEATDADLGIAHDGDADRAVFVDEQGSIVDGGAALSALAMATSDPGDTIVAAITAPSSLASVAEERGAGLELTRVGAVNVLTRVRDLHSAGRTVSIAGEQNGGVIFPPYRLSRDGAYTLGRMLELVTDRPMSEVVAPFGDRAYRRRDLPLTSVDGSAVRLTREWGTQQDGSITEVDGVRIDLDDRWILVRESGTEPLVRVYAEGATLDEADELIDRVIAAITAD